MEQFVLWLGEFTRWFVVIGVIVIVALCIMLKRQD